MELEVGKGEGPIKNKLLEAHNKELATMNAKLLDAEKRKATHVATVDTLRPTRDKEAARVAAFKRRFDNSKRRHLRAEASYTRVSARAQEINRKIDDATVGARAANEELTKLKAQKIAYEAGADGITPEAAVESLVRSLMSVSSLVDKTIPIIVQPKKFEWTTRPIFIKDKDGVPLRFAFGRFKIHLSIDGGGRFIKTFTALEPALRDGYVHPHIASHIPCLGNAEQLLVEALRANDIAAAIHITDEHLTGYNPASPYRMLETWVHSRYNQALCQCGMVIISECGCDSCSDCGAALLDPSKTSEHGCGCCTKCCKAKHTQTALTKINNAGINGSACVHAKLVKVRRTESVFYDRQA